MKQQTSKKVKLNRETIRTLSPKELETAGGGSNYLGGPCGTQG